MPPNSSGLKRTEIISDSSYSPEENGGFAPCSAFRDWVLLFLLLCLPLGIDLACMAEAGSCHIHVSARGIKKEIKARVAISF